MLAGEYYGRAALVLIVGLLIVECQYSGGAEIKPASNSSLSSRSQYPRNGTGVLVDEDEVDDFVPFQGERFNIFDWNLCKSISKSHPGNVLISPISIKLALVLLYEGAQDQTAYELAGVMQLPVGRPATRDRFSQILKSLKTTSPEYTLNIATRIYVDSTISLRQRYGAIIKSFYDADVLSANFSNAHVAAGDINRWVSNVTQGNIGKMIEDETRLADEVMVVANALFFKGSWHRNPFSISNTKAGTFYKPDGNVQVPYMNAIGRFYYSEAPELDAKILRLPYQGHKYAMFIVLPRTRSGLGSLLRDINPFILTRHVWLMQDTPVDVSIPKFKFEFTSQLETILRELGIREIFDDTATLTGIARSKRTSRHLVVSEIIQKAGIEINEQGTSAFAATDVHLGNKMAEQTFYADHPFVFFIEDESTGTIVFVGKVTNPLEVASSNAVERYNFFSIELLQTINQEREGNVVLAPASVKAALTTLVEGTRGRTQEELVSTLRLPYDVTKIRELAKRTLAPFKDVRSGTVIELATRLWTAQGVQVKPEYINALQQYYGGDVQSVDFANAAISANTINNWVDGATHGNIKSLVEPGSLPSDTQMLLTTTLYFKGSWAKSFNGKYTRQLCFNVPNRGCTQAYMMESISKYRYAYVPSLDADVIEIPYSDNRMSMLILLPSAEKGETALKTLSKDLSYTPISTLLGTLRDTEILLLLPRFAIESKLDLRPSLERLGIKDLFDVKSNLSGILTKGSARIGSVIHNAKIVVDETGTVAAAVTGISVVPLMGSTLQTIRVDRPFIFALVDLWTNSILFAGRVVDPTASLARSSTRP
ncbi:heparin cofactor 2 isoform X2 [Orussus abietinus]|uniref:heparin cofactor 2 isoform X2 n=1 Tax=Orussus abietinus TaxID=222816 RepID=UPI0006258C49|nr:heparin cofactor 2 isoform X2 [Orussus abietinus]